MREIVFRVLVERPGLLQAESTDPCLIITAESREELHHEAREALIGHFGAAHAGWRVRFRPMDGSGAPHSGGTDRLPRPIGCG